MSSLRGSQRHSSKLLTRFTESFLHYQLLVQTELRTFQFNQTDSISVNDVNRILFFIVHELSSSLTYIAATLFYYATRGGRGDTMTTPTVSLLFPNRVFPTAFHLENAAAFCFDINFFSTTGFEYPHRILKN